MVTTAPSEQQLSTSIRKIDLARDLERVADLIEMCFPIASDPDGLRYVNQMRKSAREMRMVSWFSQVAEMGNTQTSGFVWEENEQIIGNLSIIPYRISGTRLTMIANVAVHPDHRRKGIAKALTTRALGYLRRRNVGHVWLQVRDDNPPAINLYRSLGFKDQAVRTTWRIKPEDIKHPSDFLDENLIFSPRKKGYWAFQKELLENTYPKGIRWNFPVNFSRFTPGIVQQIFNILDGFHLRHWAIGDKNQLYGVITWQKSDSYANNLWLAISEKDEHRVLPMGLVKVCKRLSPRHPLSIDYPAGRFKSEFEALGFERFRTLIWMEVML